VTALRYVDEFRDPETARRLLAAIHGRARRPWTVMEVCGGQTHTFVRFGLDRLLPDTVTLVHGPGCPVCVTPVEMVDLALAVARRPEVILASFGDMLRVPGSDGDLLGARAAGAEVRMVYSPLDAIALAERHPAREVVFFAVGFETTAPATAGAVWEARARQVANFSMLVSHVLVPPAMEAILAGDGCRVQAFLAAGHVCAVMGFHEYEPLAERYRVPIVVTGFEPSDLLQGTLMAVEMLEAGRWGVANQYSRAVSRSGNLPAQELIRTVFTVVERTWRGIGPIPSSGLSLQPEFAAFDAALRFGLEATVAGDAGGCIAGRVLQGLSRPVDCPAFGTRCTPEQPLGAPMVSSEGACAAYYHYGRLARPEAGGVEPPVRAPA
jgi:hydrogenase expression/formation protein HypD